MRSRASCGNASARAHLLVFCDACLRVSGGNPFLLGELLSALVGEHLAPTSANAAYVDRASPDSVRRVVLEA